MLGYDPLEAWVGRVTPFGDWVPVDEIYWCSVPGWTALSLAGVIGCQSTVAWWSQQWPPEGNNCVVINIVISLSCAAFVLLPALMFEYIYDVTTAINIFWLDLTWLEGPPSLTCSYFTHQNHGISTYRKVSNISRTKSQNLSGSRLVLQLSLPNPLKLGVESRMKM